MSDINENKDSEAEADSSLIGVDPLAWLSDEEKETVLQQSQEQETQDSVPENIEETTVAKEIMSEPDENVEEETKELEQADKTTYTVSLEDAVTIRDVAELMDELSFISEETKEVVFDCSNIEKTDAAALQLLTGYYLFAIEEGKTVTWNNPTEAFCHAVSLLGLDDIINISLAA